MPRQVTIVLALGLLVAGCGGDPRPAPGAATPTPAPSVTRSDVPSSPSTPSGTAAVTPGAAGRGSGADDLDGDGRADLVVQAEAPDGRRYQAIVHGSARGLDLRSRTVVPPEPACAPKLPASGWGADLDGDGFADVLGIQPGEAGPRLCVFWGPRGLTDGTPTLVTWPVKSSQAGGSVIPGDFDGDGFADLAASARPEGGFSDTELVVLSGPFRRDGTPARWTARPSPSGEEFWQLAADRIDGRHATGLIVYEPGDDDQSAGWLLSASPGGPAKEGRRLNGGLSAAFGDFDGDGARDVAVGDSGSRNNEPGYETEPPSVDRTLTVYYGNGRTATHKGTAGPAIAGDFDGDGRDDLAFGGGGPYERYRPVRVFRGGPGGLRAGAELGGVRPGRPYAAGDFDGDGDDEFVLSHGRDRVEFIVTDGRRELSRFTVAPG
ncbi:FG-GAP-like repeat-containing protein [Nonomuraea sp. CA-218870]|uniref:FG-GAP repeat domain-containing protein n=1 Tax=Nonomuraea sp. CA-218870 TaxID=3239998 RepID=UPI003D8D663E